MSTDLKTARADMWDISVSYARVTGLASDFNLGLGNTWVNQGALNSGNEASMGPDSSVQSGPFDQNGSDKPVYRLKDGLAVDQVPYPAQDQLVPITDYSVYKKGDRLPYFIVSKATLADGIVYGGSRDDIKVGGGWIDGKWAIELSRKLNTGNKDDIQFNAAGGNAYTFAFGIRGKSVRQFDETYTSSPISLRFEQ
jgi:hypothetical protein